MTYSSPVLEHFFHPRHGGTLASPHGVGEAGSPQEGNVVQMFISVAQGRITQARFLSFTCPVGVAACDVTAQMAQGMTLEEALALSPEAVSETLGGVPLEKMNRCHLAVSAMREAVADFLARTTPRAASPAGNEKVDPIVHKGKDSPK